MDAPDLELPAVEARPERPGADDPLALAADIAAAREAGDARTTERLLLRLAGVRLSRLDAPGALRVFEEAARLSRRRDEPPVAAAVGAAEAALSAGDLDAMRRWIEEVGAHLDGEADEFVRARGVGLQLVAEASATGRFDGRRWAQALEALDGPLLETSRWRLGMGWAAALELHGMGPDALDVYEEIADEARHEGRPERLGPARAAAGRLLCEVGRLAEADEALAEAAAAARETGDLVGVERCLRMGSDLAIRMGVPRLATTRLHERAELSALRGDAPGRARLLVQALRAAVRGAVDDLAHELAAETMDAMLGLPPGEMPASVFEDVATDVEATGREEEARDLLLHTTRLAFGGGDPRGAVRLLERAARLTAAIGDRVQAREMWDEAVAVASHHRLDEAASLAWDRDRFFAVDAS